MTVFTSYAQTAEFFAKARKKEAGRPIGPSGWRLYKDGEEYVVTIHDKHIARIMPNNTLVMQINTALAGVVMVVQHVLPILIHRRGKDHYRLHIRKQGGRPQDLKAYGLTNWAELRTNGLRLYEGLTIDLNTRQPVDYREPVQLVDTDKRKVWLSQSRRIKRILKTIAKMEGFQPRIDKLTGNRWTYTSLHSAGEADIQIIIDAMLNDNIEPLIQRMAETFHRHAYFKLSTEDMERIIDNIFTSNSLALRKALGVIEIQQ